MHFIYARPQEAYIICAAVMFYVLTPTSLELSDEDSLSAPDLSVFYKITGSKIK